MMNYDKALVQRFREKAVTDVEKFVVGKVYYSNDLGRFVLKRLITNADYYEEVGLKWDAPDGDKLGWFETKGQKGKGRVRSRICSLHDSNIGASYNPWLIFEDKETMEEYKKLLNIWYPSHDSFDDGS